MDDEILYHVFYRTLRTRKRSVENQRFTVSHVKVIENYICKYLTDRTANQLARRNLNRRPVFQPWPHHFVMFLRKTRNYDIASLCTRVRQSI